MRFVSLPYKILIAILVLFNTAKNVTVLFWQCLCQFSLRFLNFWKNHTWQILLTGFVLADVGNVKVKPNVMEADDAASMQQRAATHCLHKMIAVLICERS